MEELQSLGTLPEGAQDTAPQDVPKGGSKPSMKTSPSTPLPPFRAGVISKGMNGLYRRAGRLIRLWDMQIGSAVIASTRAVDEDDVTVGDAWENLARTNPRIRAFLMKLMSGGAWTGLFTAHLPILLAIAMKDGIRERIPFMSLADTLLTDDPEEPDGAPVPSGVSEMLGGINPNDMAQMMAMAQGFMGQVAADMPRKPPMPREPVNGQAWAETPREHPTAGQG